MLVITPAVIVKILQRNRSNMYINTYGMISVDIFRQTYPSI